MTLPANPSSTILSDAEWHRLSSPTQRYVYASFELLEKSEGHLINGDLRQASEMAWGSAAQIVKAVAENWNLSHKSHQDLLALVDMLVPLSSQSTVEDGFDIAQNLHRNFYENNASEVLVTLAVQRMAYFIDDMLPWLRRTSQPRQVSLE
ncbi:MAG: hypothetical protein OXL37_06765 [Chloroflexota bacterium]|nr:hypothetical protein [Chloroflexota bacterium]MDE2960800.1 hypothetical protein [Chloroflexota bacterium]